MLCICVRKHSFSGFPPWFRSRAKNFKAQPIASPQYESTRWRFFRRETGDFLHISDFQASPGFVERGLRGFATSSCRLALRGDWQRALLVGVDRQYRESCLEKTSTATIPFYPAYLFVVYPLYIYKYIHIYLYPLGSINYHESICLFIKFLHCRKTSRTFFRADRLVFRGFSHKDIDEGHFCGRVTLH